MQRENPFDTYAVGYFPHGERGAIAATIHLDDQTLESLKPLFLALNNLYLETKSVSDTKGRQIFFKLAIFEFLYDLVHHGAIKLRQNPQN
jgi:hypothetical protein